MGIVEKPTIIQAAGNIPKVIEEFVGRVNTGTEVVSIARMRSPAGWKEPFQTPEFDEYSIVLSGELHVTTGGDTVVVKAGQAFCALKGQCVGYLLRRKRGRNILRFVRLLFRQTA